MKCMLDTDTCIYLIKSHCPEHHTVLQKLIARPRDEITVSVMTFSELACGIENDTNKKRRVAALRALEEFAMTINVLNYSWSAVSTYGSVHADLKRRGLEIGAMDTLIAAHCLSEGLTLVTNNTRHFSRVKDLKLDNWAKN